LNIRLDPSACVRYSSKLSQCRKCEEICGFEAIKCEDFKISIFQERCVLCAACVGVCPTEAIEMKNFSIKDFFFDFIKEEESKIGCKYNFVCLSALNVEYLISLALIKDIVLDLGHCENCELDEKVKKQIESNIKEANFILQKISKKEIKSEKLLLQKEKKTDRRDFFKAFSLKNAQNLAKEKEEELKYLKNPTVSIDAAQSAKKREKIIPNKRKILYSVLKRAKKPNEYDRIESNKISFVSSKEIDESCDNCSICYRICPSGALSSNIKESVIYFDDMLCLKCHLCHDVCEKDSIKISPFFDTKEFFNPSQKVLKQFEVIRCNECGNFFTYLEGEKICRRCKIEEEEAKNLWGF